jgi:uncharacterized membrane protein YfcA
VALAAAVGAGSLARHGHVCWRLALTFSAPAAAGSLLGALANNAVSGPTLILAFVPVMLLAAFGTWQRAGRSHDDRDGGCPPPAYARVLAAGLIVGLLTGFFGVGGGFLIVPALVLGLGVGMVEAVGTSLLVIIVSSLVALADRLHGGEVDWSVIAPFAAAAVIGVLAGSALGDRASSRALTRWFAALVVLTALYTGGEALAALL